MSESGSKHLPWNEHTLYALGFHRRIGCTLGIWPLTSGNQSAKVQFFVVVVLQLVLNCNLIQEFVNGCVSLGDAVDYIGVFGTTASSLLKILVIRVHQREMFAIVEAAVEDWSISRDSKSHEIMHRHAYIGRIVSILQLCSVYASAVIILLMAPPTLGGSTYEHSNASNFNTIPLRNMPMGTGCLVVDMPNFLYLAFYCFQALQLLNLCNCIMGSDALFFAIAMHLCAQIELLKINMTQLGQNIKQENIREELVSLIQRHNHLSCHMNFIEDIFNLMILGQLASSALHISLFGVKILFSLRDADYVTIVHSLMAATHLLRQIYIYSYAGDYLASQMREIREAAYNCYWYNFPPNITKDVMLVMVRTNLSFCLTAGRIYPMNIASFTVLLKTLLSFFSVLKLTMLIMNYNLIQEFVNGCVDASNFSKIIGLLAAATASLVKISAIRIHRKGMNLLLESALYDWWVVNDDNSRKIMYKYAYFGRFVSIFQISTAYASCVLLILTVPPTLGQTPNEPFGNLSIPAVRNIPMGSGCSVFDAPLYLYLASYAFQFIQIITASTCTVGCDSIFIGLAMHLCGQLELLHIDIAQLGHDTGRKNVQEDFVGFIGRHNHLAHLVNLIEEIFHLAILGQLAATVLHISLLGIEFLYGLRDGDSIILVYSSITIATLLRQIFIYSYAGDYLAFHTNAIREAAYNCGWYNLSPSFARDVMFVVVKNNGSFHLTAGKLFRMNIESFTSLLKTMMSAFSAMKLTIVK